MHYENGYAVVPKQTPQKTEQAPASSGADSAVCSLSDNINKTLLSDEIKARVKAGELTNEQTPNIKSIDDLNAILARSGAAVTPYALTRVDESALPKTILGEQLEATKAILAVEAARIERLMLSEDQPLHSSQVTTVSSRASTGATRTINII